MTIRAIFVENGRFEVRLKAYLVGTGQCPKGMFRCHFDHQLFIFVRGPPAFLECACPELYVQQISRRSEQYSWRMAVLKSD